MRQRIHHSATALIAVLGVFTALAAPAMACGIGVACPMRAAAPHCAVAEGSATCGGDSLTSAPPLCCTTAARAPAATLRDAAPTRIDWTNPVVDAPVSTTDAPQPAALSPHELAQAAALPASNTLSLNSVLLL